jgi:hypothetical protein
MAWPGTTDQLRSLFLKGFKLSEQGKFEDPTYLGFKVVIDFGNLPVDTEFGQPPSPLFRKDNYSFQSGNSGFFSLNPFGQPAYSVKGSQNVSFYSAQGYLRQRESQFFNGSGGKRADILNQFSVSLKDLLDNYPWFLKSIDGLDALVKVARTGYIGSDGDSFKTSRTLGKPLTFTCLESLNQRMTALGEMYKQATFDADYMRETVPRNLRRFKMYIFVTEIRNFFKTSRLIASSAALTTINNLSSLVGNNNNPGSTNSVNTANSFSQTFGSDPSQSPSAFSGLLGNVIDNSGLDGELSLFRNQSDQSGIKPILIIECSNCEFDFDDSTSVPSSIDAGSESATPAEYSFKIHVGRVRTKYQFPNIRSDQNPLILSDGWDQSKSSVMQDPTTTGAALGIAGELLTNFLSNTVDDFINEGVAQYLNPALSGLDQTLLGNIYSLNPSQILSDLSYNSAQNFLDQVTNSELSLRNLDRPLPNPQTTGFGGPPARVYGPPSDAGESDVYSGVPGRDLGVNVDESIGRVYPAEIGGQSDVYRNVPGNDLGVPDRVYPDSNIGSDVYPTSPGSDLGAPDRVYPEVNSDVYSQVPGEDLGVPGRVYPPSDGDFYPDVPGSDLGGPARVYPAPGGDVYDNVPGEDLGGPARVYPAPGGDAYANVPGSDLGVPDRLYPPFREEVYPPNLGTRESDINEKVYPPNVPNANSDLGSYDVYPPVPPTTNAPNSIGDVYPPVPPVTNGPNSIGDVYPGVGNFQTTNDNAIGRVYPKTVEDFVLEKIISQKDLTLGNMKPIDKYNISLGDFNPPESDFEM